MPFYKIDKQKGEVLQLSIREPNVSLLQHHRLLTGKINSRRSIYNKDLALTLIMLLAVSNGALTIHYNCPALMDPPNATLSKRYPHNLLCNFKFYITFYVAQVSHPFLDMVKLNYPLSKQSSINSLIEYLKLLRSRVHIFIELSLKGIYQIFVYIIE